MSTSAKQTEGGHDVLGIAYMISSDEVTHVHSIFQFSGFSCKKPLVTPLFGRGRGRAPLHANLKNLHLSTYRLIG